MSRATFYKDSRLTVVQGVDHILGEFWQIFDNNIETPEGEGLVLDWSLHFGFERNFTGIPNNEGVMKIVIKYVEEHGDEVNDFEPLN